MPSVPSQWTATCEICGIQQTAPQETPEGWSRVAGPTNDANQAPPAFLCPQHTEEYKQFWTPRPPEVNSIEPTPKPEVTE